MRTRLRFGREEHTVNNPSVPTPPPAVRKPNLILGLIGGTIAMIVCAVIWASLLYPFQTYVNWIAVILGLAVGFGARWLAKGGSRRLGLIAAILSLIGCILSHFIAYSSYYMRIYDWTISEPFARLDFLAAAFRGNFVPLDLLFYAVGICLAFLIAYRQPKRAVGQPA
jgi:uncharacterized membrane protein YeaQ/YmgE (transglycosylase-associated protein family)